MIAIIDYDAGNIKSVEKAFAYLGQDARITRDKDEILASERVVLPGVGSFGDAMGKLKEYGLDRVIYDVVDKKIPFLGICLGLQLLYESSDETPGVTGLGLLEGTINRIPDHPGLKIPHMGWNSLDVRPGATLFQGLEENPYVYFVHSYYLHVSSIRRKAVRLDCLSLRTLFRYHHRQRRKHSYAYKANYPMLRCYGRTCSKRN